MQKKTSTKLKNLLRPIVESVIKESSTSSKVRISSENENFQDVVLMLTDDSDGSTAITLISGNNKVTIDEDQLKEIYDRAINNNR